MTLEEIIKEVTTKANELKDIIHIDDTLDCRMWDLIDLIVEKLNKINHE